MADNSRSRNVPNWLAALIVGAVSVVSLVLVAIAVSQPINLWRIDRWIAQNSQAWSQFVAEHPRAKEVRLFAYTGGNGMLGVVMDEVDEETALQIEEFISAHDPPRPAYYVYPVRGNDQRKSDSRDVVRFAGKDAKEGLIESIGGISINFPASEKLDWISAKDIDAIDAKLIALGRAKESPAIAGKYTPVVDRYVSIGDYVFLSGHYDPPFPDGSFNWVINKKDMKYVGHFFDKDSR